MIERNFLDQTQDRELRRPPQRMVQSNFGMEEQRRIAEQGLSQNERVLELPNQGGGMPANPDGRSYAGGSPGLYAPGGKFNPGSGSMGMPANPYRDRMARLPDLSQPANAAIRQQVQGNLPADAQPIQIKSSCIDVIKFDEVGQYLIELIEAAAILRRRIKIKKTEVFQTLTEILTAIACQATNLNMAAEAALACNNLDMAEGWV
jgi:hypothetical protein